MRQLRLRRRASGRRRRAGWPWAAYWALGAASCCIIPFALFLAGVSGAWIGALTALEPYQPIFAAISLAFIGAGAWRLRKKRQIACADGYCATSRSDRIARIGLVVAATLVVIAVGFPYAARYFL